MFLPSPRGSSAPGAPSAGPPASIAAAYENAQVFFSLLDALPPDGLAPSPANSRPNWTACSRSPIPSVSESCGIQLMTIHKAKGLGFDVVVVPGLERTASGDDNPLVCSLERIDPWRPGETEFLVAPIGLHGEDTEPLYRWVRRQRQIRFDEERKRLFYVACTRARRELHLLGAAVYGASGLRPPTKAACSQTAWPALQDEFEAAARAPQPASAQPRVLAFPAPGVLEEVAAVAAPDSAPGPRRLLLDTEPVPGHSKCRCCRHISRPLARCARFPPSRGIAPGPPDRLHGAYHAAAPRAGSCRPSPRPISVPGPPACSAPPLSPAKPSRLPPPTVTKMLRACAADPVCRWILAAHPDAQSEVSWSGYLPEDPARACAPSAPIASFAPVPRRWPKAPMSSGSSTTRPAPALPARSSLRRSALAMRRSWKPTPASFAPCTGRR